MEKLLMNRLSINAALMFVLSARALTASAATSEALAQSPPMGWNSFDSYGVYLHEQAALANLEAMAEKLLPYGYEYFVIDNGWFGEYTLQEGTIFPAEKHAHDIRIDDNLFGTCERFGDQDSNTAGHSDLNTKSFGNDQNIGKENGGVDLVPTNGLEGAFCDTL